MYLVTEKAFNESGCYFYLTPYETFEEALTHTHNAIAERMEHGLEIVDCYHGKECVHYELEKGCDKTCTIYSYSNYHIDIDEMVAKETIEFSCV